MELRVLYCRCAYAKVVPDETKNAVLDRLCASGKPFDSVADLCEMSARRDPALQKIAESPAIRIAACYPRAVRGLFHAAGAPLDESRSHVLNMRDQSADQIIDALHAEGAS